MPRLSCSSQPSAFPTCKIKKLIVISHSYLKKSLIQDITWRVPWPEELVHQFVVDTSPLCTGFRRELWILARRERRFRLDRPSAGPAQTLVVSSYMLLFLHVGLGLWLQSLEYIVPIFVFAPFGPSRHRHWAPPPQHRGCCRWHPTMLWWTDQRPWCDFISI